MVHYFEVMYDKFYAGKLSELLGSWTLSNVRSTFLKLDLFPSSRERETPTLLGP
jgi:hypothetical protein